MPVFVSCVLDFRVWLFSPHEISTMDHLCQRDFLPSQPLPLGPTDGQDQSVSRVSDSIVSPFWASRPLKQPSGCKTYHLPLDFVFLKSDNILLNWRNVLPNQKVYSGIRVDSWKREIIEGGNLRAGVDTICWIAEWYLECVGGGAVVVLNSVGSTVTKHFTAAETTRWKRTRSPRLPQSPPCHPFLSHPGGYVRHHPAPPTPPLNTVHMFALLMMMACLGEGGGLQMRPYIVPVLLSSLFSFWPQHQRSSLLVMKWREKRLLKVILHYLSFSFGN